MTRKQIFGYGLAALLGNTLWNIFTGELPAYCSAQFGGAFAMLGCLLLASWVVEK